MKAVVLKSNKKLSFINKPLNDLENNHCRIKIQNVGLFSSDIQRSYGNGAYFYPLIMGHEISGEISEIGSNISNYSVGDRITVFPLLPCFNCEPCEREMYAQCYDYSYFGSRTDGGYAEYLDVPEWNILKLPEDVSFQDAALIEPLSVVVHALKRFGLVNANIEETPEKTIVIGAGFLGILAVQIIRSEFPDLELAIIDRNAFKLKIAEKYVDEKIQLNNGDEWLKFLDKHSFHNVIEATGSPDSFRHTISLAAHGGNILWMGNITDELTLPKDLVSTVLRKELSILGTWNSIYRPQKPDDWKDSIEFIQNGVRPSELVSHWISLEELPDTLKKLYDHKVRKKAFDSVKVMVNNRA